MPLNPATLASEITANVQAIPGISITNLAELQASSKAIADAVVAHIVANGLISVTIPALSIITVGSAATQSGPSPLPLPLTGTIS